MSRLNPVAIVIAIASACVACSNTVASDPVNTPAVVSEDTGVAAPPLNNSEIISGLPQGTGSKKVTPGKDVPLSTSRTDLLRFANDSMKKKDFDQAAAFADVLLLMSPGDAESMELRARALIASGDMAGGNADLDACCALGRKTCCRGKSE